MGRRRGRPLGPGSLIAVPTPASPLLDLSYLESGVAWVESQGFRVRLTEHANIGESFKAGPPNLRAADLNAAFSDSEVDAICPLAGGHAAPGVLRYLDYDLIGQNPKPFVAFSELTALHVPLIQKAGLVTFYGPMVSSLDVIPAHAQAAWVRALTSTEPLGVLDPDGPPARTIVPGVTEGDLVGGTLSLVETLLGTSFELDTRGKVLLLEDIGEEPPRIDRFLTHLLNAGKLQQCAGIWLGEFRHCVPHEGRPLFAGHNLTVEQLFDELLGSLGIPAIHGLPVGHGRDALTIPLGLRVRLDADAGRVEFLEPALANSLA